VNLFTRFAILGTADRMNDQYNIAAVFDIIQIYFDACIMNGNIL